MSVFERVRLLGFGVLAVTFIAGALAGAAIDRAVTEDTGVEARSERRGGGDGDDRRYIIDRVDMSGDQRATIDSILERRVVRMQAVWREVEPRLDAITDSARTEIMSVLTPEQQAEYEAMLERRRQERRDRERRHQERRDGESPGDQGAAPASGEGAADQGDGQGDDAGS